MALLTGSRVRVFCPAAALRQFYYLRHGQHVAGHQVLFQAQVVDDELLPGRRILVLISCLPSFAIVALFANGVL